MHCGGTDTQNLSAISKRAQARRNTPPPLTHTHAHTKTIAQEVVLAHARTIGACGWCGGRGVWWVETHLPCTLTGVLRGYQRGTWLAPASPHLRGKHARAYAGIQHTAASHRGGPLYMLDEPLAHVSSCAPRLGCPKQGLTFAGTRRSRMIFSPPARCRIPARSRPT